MNVHDSSARDRQLRKTVKLWIGAALLVAGVLWLLGAPRFALYSAVVALTFGVVGWGPSEQRIPPDEPNKPCRVAAPATAAAALVALVVGSLALLPHPEFMFGSGVLPGVFAIAWLRTRRWPRVHPPTA
jgi:hypothetical protein